MTYDDATKLADEIVERIRPLLAGHSPPLQGMVVAELTAIWLAGHDPSLRDDLLTLQLETIAELVPLWHEHLRERGRRP